MRVRVDQVLVGARRREELGDLNGLAESIKRFGMLHPIVVDNSLQLVAGERRLRAIQQLGWREVEVRPLGSLTEAERREIELEENLRRKDLTPLEQSKFTVALAETARVIEADTSDRGVSAQHGPKLGRPSDPISERTIADRIGVPRATLGRAQQHVAAVERYPELESAPQSTALRAAKTWDEMQPDEANQARLRLARLARLKGGEGNLSIQDFEDSGVKMPDPPGPPPPEAGAVEKLVRLATLLKLDPVAIADAEAEAYGSDGEELEALAEGVERIAEWATRVVIELRRRAQRPLRVVG